jgi:hypothetical protein
MPAITVFLRLSEKRLPKKIPNKPPTTIAVKLIRVPVLLNSPILVFSLSLR